MLWWWLAIAVAEATETAWLAWIEVWVRSSERAMDR